MAELVRSPERVTEQNLAKLAAIAAARWRPYADRILCVALCQGAALHYVDGSNGVKDFDVYTFYAEHPEIGSYPARWPIKNVDFGPSRFGRNPEDEPSYEGRRIDLLGRSLKAKPNADPAKAVRAYLHHPRTKTAQAPRGAAGPADSRSGINAFCRSEPALQPIGSTAVLRDFTRSVSDLVRPASRHRVPIVFRITALPPA